MGIAIVALLAFGGSFAYFTATATAPSQQVITTAKIGIGSSPATLSFTLGYEDAALPGDEVQLDFSVDNVSTRKSYVFLQFTIGGTKTETLGFNILGTVPSGWEAATLSNVGGKDYANVYYYVANASDADSDPTTSISWTSTATITETGNSNSENGADAGNQNKTITIDATVAATQYAETTTTEGSETAFAVADAFALVASNFAGTAHA